MSPRTLVLAAGLALALTVPGIQAAAVLMRAIDTSTSHPGEPWRSFDTTGPELFDVDGDGVMEIIDQNENRRVVVVDSATGQVRAELETRFPPGWGARPLNQVQAARSSSGTVLVVGNSAAVVTLFQFEGVGADGRFRFDKAWDFRLDQHEPNPGMDGDALPADVDGDGTVEVLAQSETKGVYVLDADGRVRWSAPAWGGNAGPAAGDLDGDGRLEAVFASDGGHVQAFDAASGKPRWTFWAGSIVSPAAIPVAPTLADLDGDGRQEVLFTARDAHDALAFGNNHLALVALNHDGSLRWSARPAWGNPLSYTHLVAADADGDGRKEVFGMDWNTMGHQPGAWERLGPANVFAFSADGQELWHRAVDNYWSNDDVAVADTDADGALEVLAVGALGGRDGVFVLDARTGALEEHVSAWPYKVARGPEVADLDSDGDLDWVVSVHGMAEGTRGGGFLVFSGGGTAGGALPGQPPMPGPGPDLGNGTAPLPASEPRPRPPGQGGLLRVLPLRIFG